MLQKDTIFYNHIEIMCVTCLNILKMGIQTGAKNVWAEHWSTHWRRVMHKCVSKLTIIGSDNGLSPGRRQAIIWTNAGI